MPSFFFRPTRRLSRKRGFLLSKNRSVLLVQVTEALILEDTVPSIFTWLPLPMTEGLTIGESVTMGTVAFVPIVNIVGIGDSATLRMPLLPLAVTEALTVTDLVPDILTSATRLIAITEPLTVGEILTFSQPILLPSVTDALTVGEVVTHQGPLAQVQVTDALTVGESPLLNVGVLTVPVGDGVAVGETPTIRIPVLRTPVTDAVSLTEFLILRRATLGIQITEALTLGDTTTLFRFLLIPDPQTHVNHQMTLLAFWMGGAMGGHLSVIADAVTVGETITVRGLRLGIAGITQPITLTETVSVQLQLLQIQVSEPLSVIAAPIFFVLPPVITVPNAPRPLEERHWADQLFLTLQRCETTYNVLISPWDATTTTLMNQVDDDTVHEVWDDQVHGHEYVRTGFQVANVQVLTHQSVRIAFTQPRITPHTLAGLLGLTLGEITSDAQPATANSYRHSITLAAPTRLPSISAQAGHQLNRYYAYGGLKSNGFTLESNGPYVKFACPLIGSGSRTDVTGTTRSGLTFQAGTGGTTGTPPAPPPPTSHRITDLQGGIWYLFPDGRGGLTVDVAPPTGISLSVGTGLTLRSMDGGAWRLGVSGTGALELTGVGPPGGPVVIDVAILDSTGIPWYVWVEDALVTIGTANPSPPVVPPPVPGIPGTVNPEAWLRWGNSHIWLANGYTGTPDVPIQGQPVIGGTAIEVSNRVLSLSVQGDNQLLAADAYRLSTGRVRGNFHAQQRQLRVSLALEVTSATEAGDLTDYLTQRPLALEWQCLGPSIGGGAWQPGFVVILPYMQYRTLGRQQQQQTDVLQLTGTLLEEAPGHTPVVATVYNAQPSYLQPA